jgi:hypothetical protein
VCGTKYGRHISNINISGIEVQIYPLLGYYAESCRNFFPTFRDNVSVLYSLLTHEDGTDTLSRNVGKQLPLDAA